MSLRPPQPIHLRRALDAISLALFTYLAAVVSILAAVAGHEWSPPPFVLGAAASVAVGAGAWVFPRWAARVARRELWGDLEPS